MNETATTPKNINEGIHNAIAARLQDVKLLVAGGMDREAAIAKVRETSALGDTSWATLRAWLDLDSAAQSLAVNFQKAAAKVDITAVPVLSLDRHIDRKVQAKLARRLFAQLGLHAISVTTPRYSMASHVAVKLPHRRDYVLNSWGQIEDGLTDPAHQANRDAEKRIEAILLAAFPNSDNRSDTQTDHFDFRWSVD